MSSALWSPWASLAVGACWGRYCLAERALAAQLSKQLRVFRKLDTQVLYLPALLEGLLGSANWAASKMGAKGGKAKTPAKVAAARANGAKGGRPRKKCASGGLTTVNDLDRNLGSGVTCFLQTNNPPYGGLFARCSLAGRLRNPVGNSFEERKQIPLSTPSV